MWIFGVAREYLGWTALLCIAFGVFIVLENWSLLAWHVRLV